MKGVTGQRGLSARQKTHNNFSSYWFLLHPAWMFVALAGIIASCKSNGQERTELKKSPATVSDTLDNPRVNIKVNRQYDEKGNVIGLDSTYTSFYSNVEGDTTKMDSLFRHFDRHFHLSNSSFLGRNFDSLFFTDSLRYPDFFHDDFFLKRYELNDLYLRDMMRRMDSLKNNFYREHSMRSGDESSDK